MSESTPEIELLEPINSGLFGVVWKARQNKLGRVVAVKLIKRSMAHVANAIDHARALARVKHPNVVTVHYVTTLNDPGTGEPVDGIVMDLLEGESFAERLCGPPWTFDSCRKECESFLAGLAAIHASGIPHGDLHDGNVILSKNGATVIDIGYKDPDSFACLGTCERESLIAADVACARGIIFRAVRHADLRLDVLSNLEAALRPAQSIDDLKAALQSFSATDTASPRLKIEFLELCLMVDASLPQRLMYKIRAKLVNESQPVCRHWAVKVSFSNQPPGFSRTTQADVIQRPNEEILHSLAAPFNIEFSLSNPGPQRNFDCMEQLRNLTISCIAISEYGLEQQVDINVGTLITEKLRQEIVERINRK